METNKIIPFCAEALVVLQARREQMGLAAAPSTAAASSTEA